MQVDENNNNKLELHENQKSLRILTEGKPSENFERKKKSLA